MAGQKSSKFYEKTISSKTLFRGRIFDLIRRKVLLPDGRKSTRDLILHPGAVAMIPVDARGNILLVRQYRKAMEREMLEIPAGTLDPGESLRACVQRELQEEIGYRAHRIRRLVSYHPAAGYTTEIIHIFVAKGLVPARLRADRDEFLEVVPMKPAQILRLIRQEKINDSKTLIGMLYYWFFRKR